MDLSPDMDDQPAPEATVSPCIKCDLPRTAEHAFCPKHVQCWTAKGVYNPNNCQSCSGWWKEIQDASVEDAQDTLSWQLMVNHIQ